MFVTIKPDRIYLQDPEDWTNGVLESQPALLGSTDSDDSMLSVTYTASRTKHGRGEAVPLLGVGRRTAMSDGLSLTNPRTASSSALMSRLDMEDAGSFSSIDSFTESDGLSSASSSSSLSVFSEIRSLNNSSSLSSSSATAPPPLHTDQPYRYVRRQSLGRSLSSSSSFSSRRSFGRDGPLFRVRKPTIQTLGTWSSREASMSRSGSSSGSWATSFQSKASSASTANAKCSLGEIQERDGRGSKQLLPLSSDRPLETIPWLGSCRRAPTRPGPLPLPPRSSLLSDRLTRWKPQQPEQVYTDPLAMPPQLPPEQKAETVFPSDVMADYSYLLSVPSSSSSSEPAMTGTDGYPILAPLSAPVPKVEEENAETPLTRAALPAVYTQRSVLDRSRHGRGSSGSRRDDDCFSEPRPSRRVSFWMDSVVPPVSTTHRYVPPIPSVSSEDSTNASSESLSSTGSYSSDSTYHSSSASSTISGRSTSLFNGSINETIQSVSSSDSSHDATSTSCSSSASGSSYSSSLSVSGSQSVSTVSVPSDRDDSSDEIWMEPSVSSESELQESSATTPSTQPTTPSRAQRPLVPLQDRPGNREVPSIPSILRKKKAPVLSTFFTVAGRRYRRVWSEDSLEVSNGYRQKR